jgi:hypothetical protein
LRPKRPNQDQAEFATVSPARRRWIFPVKSCLFRDSLALKGQVAAAKEPSWGSSRDVDNHSPRPDGTITSWIRWQPHHFPANETSRSQARTAGVSGLSVQRSCRLEWNRASVEDKSSGETPAIKKSQSSFEAECSRTNDVNGFFRDNLAYHLPRHLTEGPILTPLRVPAECQEFYAFNHQA